MIKGFYDRVLREGVVDTFSYQYRVKQDEEHLIIERIRRKEIGKIDEDDMWVTVWTNRNGDEA